jgi:hypothetical protein
MQQAISVLGQRQEPVVVHVGGGRKVARAVKAPDGSWTMESNEVPEGNNDV